MRKFRSSLKTRIFSLLIITSILPMLIMSFFVDRVYTSTIENNILPMVEKNVDGLALNLSLRFTGYQAILDQCAQDTVIKEIAAAEHKLAYEKLSSSSKIQGVLTDTNYSYRVEYPFRYILYCKDKTVFSDGGYSNTDSRTQVRENVEKLPYFRDFMNTGLVNQFAGTEETLFQTGNALRFDFSRNVIAENGISSGILIFSLNKDYFDSLIDGIELSGGTGVYLYDGYGTPVYEWSKNGTGCILSSEEALECLRQDDAESMRQDDLLISSKRLGFSTNRMAWKLVCVTPLTDILNRQRLILTIIWAFTILTLSLAIIFGRSVQRDYIDPIESYSRFVSNIDFDHLDVAPKKTGADEALVLGEGLEAMVDRIKDNLQELENKEAERRRQEVTALTAQINPHFIRNTLNSIRLSAELSEAPMVAGQIQSFTRLMDYIFHADRLSTVENELSYLEEYIKLQNLRYQNKFIYTADVEDSLLNLTLPPMIFQPIVENSVVHGFAGRKGRGQIVLNGTIQNNRAVFTIEDNGWGLPENAEIGIGNHGIANVNRRIRLMYGDDYGIHAENMETGGARITIILPLKENQTCSES